MEACLIVHERSIPYIKNVAAALTETLQDVFIKGSRTVLCSSVDSADIGNAKHIFIIGENLGRFKRLVGRRYIYLNFSVVTMLGDPSETGVEGTQLIHYKNSLLRQKLDLFDALLDYYPPQTRRLVNSLNLPVAGFVPWVTPVLHKQNIPLRDRQYDVCFVGSLSTRRKMVLESLQAAGCILSPSSDVVVEDIAAQSRCTLNMHLQRSNHLEIPRVMGAIGVSPLITEDSYGLHELFPEDVVQVAPYENLVDQVLSDLADLERLEEKAKIARRWYCEIGAPQFRDVFISAVKEIQQTI